MQTIIELLQSSALWFWETFSWAVQLIVFVLVAWIIVRIIDAIIE